MYFFKSLLATEVVFVALMVAILIVVIANLRQARRMRQRYLAMEDLYKRKILEAALESQENERKRFATDLHDGVGALLAAIRLNLITLARREKRIARPLETAGSLVDATMAAIRRISHGLMPATLEESGLRPALRELCDQLSSVSFIKIAFEETGEPFSLDKGKELLIYRIVQELLQNALKHGQSGAVRVCLKWNERLIVEVTDQGGDAAAPAEWKRRGLGMLSVENRARLLGGRLRYRRNVPGGTRVELLIPAS